MIEIDGGENAHVHGSSIASKRGDSVLVARTIALRLWYGLAFCRCGGQRRIAAARPRTTLFPALTPQYFTEQPYGVVSASATGLPARTLAKASRT
jgi:hypothetical protein